MPSIVPPPWQLTGGGTILLYRFPTRWVLEHGWLPNRLRGAFAGGVGAVMLVSYTASGVGPYREALFIPGQFRVGGRLRSVVTRIVVSSEASVASGRANWGLPKELADFSVGAGRFRAGFGGEAFLDAEVAPFGPHLPLDSDWSPIPLDLAQIYEGRLYVTRPAARGAVRLARLVRLGGDQANFPDVSAFSPFLTLQVTGFTLTFPPAEIAEELPV